MPCAWIAYRRLFTLYIQARLGRRPAQFESLCQREVPPLAITRVQNQFCCKENGMFFTAGKDYAALC